MGASYRSVVKIPLCTSPLSHIAPFCNRNVHMCAHFCYKMVQCGIFVWCTVGFVRWFYCKLKVQCLSFATQCNTRTYYNESHSDVYMCSNQTICTLIAKSSPTRLLKTMYSWSQVWWLTPTRPLVFHFWCPYRTETSNTSPGASRANPLIPGKHALDIITPVRLLNK